MKQIFVLILFVLISAGCGQTSVPAKAVVSIDEYRISAAEFEEGFQQSAYASREDKALARQEYLDNLINQKVILLDAQKKGFDRKADFLQSIEHFWEQSLLMVAVGAKTKEIAGAVRIPDDKIRDLYEQMVKDGVTNKSFQEMYPQIKWQIERQMETELLNDWVDGLRKNARIRMDENFFKKDQGR